MTVSPLSVSDSSTKVANAALSLLGVPHITSFLDNSHPARVCNTLFEDVLESAICSYPWRFSQARALAQRIPDTAPPPWAGLYRIPDNIRQVRTVYADADLTGFDVFGRNVAVKISETASAQVWVEGSVIVPPGDWPGHFRLPFIHYLAGALAVPITQDERLADKLMQDGIRGLKLAASRDAQGRSPKRLDTKLFIRARRSRGAI